MASSKKRGRQRRGTGGLLYRNGKWEGRYRVYKEDGSFIEKSFTRNTETEINDIKASLRVLGILDNDVIDIKIDKRTDKITLIKRNILPQSSKKQLNEDMKVNDYVDYWLWNHRRKGMKGKMVKDTTFEDYVDKCKHIKSLFGSITLDNGKVVELKVAELTFEYMENVMLEFHKKVSDTTAVQVRNHLYNMMKYAKKDKIIKENPFQDDEINFPETAIKTEKKVIKEDDIEKVIKHCLKLWYIDVLTQLMTGGRAAEIRGLIWTDIDEKECEIKFTSSYSSVKQFKLDENNHIVSLGRKRRYSTLKSDSSSRSIKVEPEFMRILMFHKLLQKQLAKRLNIEFKETDPVFTTSTYTPYGRNDTNDRVKKIMKDLQIENWEEITSHCLRHGFCYAGLLNDVPLEYMQILLGHANISVTRKWYAHFDKSKVNSYAEKVNTNRINVLKGIENRVQVTA